MTEGRNAGTLEEPQVRAMFDRIAGVYDLMNQVMTAGLHHGWRRRAADLAQLRPGGRVVVLEITTPTRPPLSTFYRLWFDRVVPLIGRVAGDPEAYSYLPNSVKRFPGPEGLAAAMARTGLTDIADRVPGQAIARTLVNPTAPMPSFAALKQNDPKKFQNMVAFLSQLKGGE